MLSVLSRWLAARATVAARYRKHVVVHTPQPLALDVRTPSLRLNFAHVANNVQCATRVLAKGGEGSFLFVDTLPPADRQTGDAASDAVLWFGGTYAKMPPHHDPPDSPMMVQFDLAASKGTGVVVADVVVSPVAASDADNRAFAPAPDLEPGVLYTVEVPLVFRAGAPRLATSVVHATGDDSPRLSSTHNV